MGANSFLLEQIHFFEGRQNNFDRITSLESVPFSLNEQMSAATCENAPLAMCANLPQISMCMRMLEDPSGHMT